MSGFSEFPRAFARKGAKDAKKKRNRARYAEAAKAYLPARILVLDFFAFFAPLREIFARKGAKDAKKKCGRIIAFSSFQVSAKILLTA
jgi:hypothetical protein